MDLAQTASLRALPHLPNLKVSRRAYLRRVLINVHNDRLRHDRVVNSSPASNQTGRHGAEDPYAHVDMRLDVTTALSSLPSPTRQLLVLRYLEDLTCRQIAELLHRPAA